jgi:hypothetical protein
VIFGAEEDPKQRPGSQETTWCSALTFLLPVACCLLPVLLPLSSCTCGGKDERGKKGRPTVVVVDPDEVGRPKPTPEVEPNDTHKRAQPLLKDTWVEGTIGSEKDRDTYRVDVTEGGQVLQATLSGAKGLDLAIEAWGAPANSLGGGGPPPRPSAKRERLVRVNNNKEGEGEVLVNLGVDPGATYLVVREVKGQSSTASYRLAYQLRPREEGEEREPNWKPPLATPLALGGEAVGYLGWHTDADFFRVELKELAPNARIRVEYDGLDDVRAWVSVRTEANVVLQERWGGVGEAVALSNLVLASTEPVFAVVRCQYTANVESRYSLRVVSAVPPGPTEAEPNDKLTEATELPAGKPMAGILRDSQDRDLYAVKAARPSRVRVQVTPPLNLDVAVALLDDEGKPALEIDDGGPREAETIPALWVRPPRAVLQVWAPRRQHVSAAASYRITAEVLPEPVGAVEHEPNNSTAQATTWPADQLQASGFIHPKKDLDLYRLTAKAESLRLTALPVAKLQLRLELLDAGGSPVAASKSVDAQGTIQLDARTEVGTDYLLRVSDTSGSSNAREEYRIKRENR